MKIMCFNLYLGCPEKERFDNIIKFVNKYKPDVIGLLELNGWDKDNFKRLNMFKEKTGFKESIFCKTKTGFHIGLFSNKIFLDSQIIIEGLWHGAIIVKVKSGVEDIDLILTHLSPESEDYRLREIDLIINKINLENKVVLMGDLNSLSSLDNYDEKELLKEMKKLNTHKFTSRFGESHLRKEVISKIQEFGLVDALKLFSDKFEYSVPTTFNKDVDHITKLRLDYIFVTNDLKKFVKDIQIIRNDETDRLSDHFPILIEIE